MRILFFLFIVSYFMTILSQLNYLGDDDDTVPNDYILG